MAFKFWESTQSGRTMVEMLATLAIAALFGITAVFGTSYIMNMYKARQIVKGAQEGAVIVGSWRRGQSSERLAALVASKVMGGYPRTYLEPYSNATYGIYGKRAIQVSGFSKGVCEHVLKFDGVNELKKWTDLPVLVNELDIDDNPICRNNAENILLVILPTGEWSAPNPIADDDDCEGLTGKELLCCLNSDCCGPDPTCGEEECCVLSDELDGCGRKKLIVEGFIKVLKRKTGSLYECEEKDCCPCKEDCTPDDCGCPKDTAGNEGTLVDGTCCHNGYAWNGVSGYTIVDSRCGGPGDDDVDDDDDIDDDVDDDIDDDTDDDIDDDDDDDDDDVVVVIVDDDDDDIVVVIVDDDDDDPPDPPGPGPGPVLIDCEETPDDPCCVNDVHCGDCEVCSNGECVSTCTECDDCIGGSCVFNSLKCEDCACGCETYCHDPRDCNAHPLGAGGCASLCDCSIYENECEDLSGCACGCDNYCGGTCENTHCCEQQCDCDSDDDDDDGDDENIEACPHPDCSGKCPNEKKEEGFYADEVNCSLGR